MKKALILSGIEWSDTYQRHHIITQSLLECGFSVDFLGGIKSSDVTTEKIISILSNKIKKRKIKKPVSNLDVNLKLLSSFNIPSDNVIFQLLNVLSLAHVHLKLNNVYDVVVCYVPSPFSISILEKLECKCLIYDCVRNFEDWDGIYKNIKYYERKLFELSDIVLTDSYFLTNKWKDYSPIQFLPSFDGEYLERKSNINISEKIKNIGFFGTLSTHFDIDTVEYLLDAGFKMQFWGVDELNYTHKNFINNGFVSDTQLLMESIKEKCDALIIPYKGNMDGVIPAKLIQCMALKLPLFCSSFYDSLKLESKITVFRNKKELVNYLNLPTSYYHEKVSEAYDFSLNNTNENFKRKMQEIIFEFNQFDGL